MSRRKSNMAFFAFSSVLLVMGGVLIGVTGRDFLSVLLPDRDATADGARMAVQARPAGRNASSPAGRGGFSAAPAVTIATVEASAITQRLEAVGASRSRRSVTLIAEATGLVREVNFKAGDKVAKGVVLVRIEDEDQRIALARARAEFPIAKANSERFAELQKQDAASKVEAETAFNSYKAAQAALQNIIDLYFPKT